MNLPSLAAALVISSLAPAFAITDAEITPAALVGKTLTFTINTAGGDFADTGSWTGTFGTTSFIVANGPNGNTANITTTHSTVLNSTVLNSFTIVTLPQYIAGLGTTTITLFTDQGTGRYEMNLPAMNSAFQIGTFTIGTAVVPKAPEIEVKLAGDALTDGVATADFGKVKAGQGKAVRKFTVTNTGKAKLKDLEITRNGKNKGDFTVTKLGKSSLGPDADTDFQVTFKTAKKGIRTAAIHIKSNDKDEQSFDIKLTGEGK